MIFNYKDNGWRKVFCIIPFVLSDGEDKTFVWLQWYWRRFMGTHYDCSLTDPSEISTKDVVETLHMISKQPAHKHDPLASINIREHNRRISKGEQCGCSYCQNPQ